MAAAARYPRFVETARLHLQAATADDLDALHELYSDPRVWTHLPSGVYAERETTATALAQYLEGWSRFGLGYWLARRHDGTFVGIGGVSMRRGAAWNLYYRLAPAAQGNGYATELARAALAAAAAVRSDIPVTAFLLEHNTASKVVAEKVGLHLAWHGPDAGNPDPAAVRLVYSDRDLPRDLLSALVEHS